MIKSIIPMLLAGLLATPAWSQNEAAANVVPAVSDAAASTADTVLVVGQRPGPGLWKVSKGDHVLWVFGTYSPLPKQLAWRSQQVEAIIAQSQAYLLPPTAEPKVSLLRIVTLLPHAIGVNKLPDGKKLQDVLPAEVYARWLPLKAKYIGVDEALERERPLFVASKLYSNALLQSGFVRGFEVDEAIHKIVKANKLKVIATKIDIAVNDPAQMIKDFKKSALDDAQCFALTLERLETDLDAMRVRANAWTKGDLDVIRTLSFPDRESACDDAMKNSTVVKAQAGFDKVDERMEQAWLAAAETALATNRSTFARLPLKEILDPKGYLWALQKKGYTVESPE